MTMEFRIPGYFEAFMVNVLEPEETGRGFGQDADPEGEGSPDDFHAPDFPYAEGEGFSHGPEA